MTNHKACLAATLLILLVSLPATGWAQGGPIVDVNSGIDLRVRWTGTAGVVSVTWQVSAATLATGANEFELQFYVGGGQQWQTQWGTSEPNENGNPPLLGGVPDNFCFRMVATINGTGSVLGSGTSGNEPPCAAAPVDSDGDGVPDVDDAFPNNPTEWSDNDGDGVGDNADPDDDNDGLDDDEEPDIGTDPLDSDSDDDTHLDGADNCPTDANPSQLDGDGDGIGDVCDDNLFKLLASDGEAFDSFGRAVAVEGDTILVGADRDDDVASATGSVYVYTLNVDGTWTEIQKLNASDAGFFDFFGAALSISGDTAVIGAYSDDDNGVDSGSAYIFTRDGTGVWSEQQKLKASDGVVQDRFGSSVALDGDTLLIGAYSDDDVEDESGSVYVFTRDLTGVWSETQKITATDPGFGDEFGEDIVLQNDLALITARGDDHPNGNDIFVDAGSVYVYVRGPAGFWVEHQKLIASNRASFDYFGSSVALDGNTALVGATLNDFTFENTGSAYIFSRDGSGVWSEQQELIASDAGLREGFGLSVALSGDFAAIGSQTDDKGSDSGAAYIFFRDSGGIWNEQRKIVPTDADENDVFAYSIDMDGAILVAGSFSDELGEAAGAAYVHTLELPDLDGDGIPDADDEFPNDPNEWEDTDGDLIGNNADPDDDNDGLSDIDEIAAGTDPLNSDSDGDTLLDGADNCPLISNPDQIDADGDGKGDHCDTDSFKLVPVDGDINDWFGSPVAVDGNTALIGAAGNDDDGGESGSAYIFEKNQNGVWVEGQKLTASDAAPAGLFGSAVSLQDDTALISSAVSVYVFERDMANNWAERQKFTATDLQAGERFSGAVIDDDTAMVGSSNNGETDTNAGAAYVFTRDAGGVWSEQQKLLASDGAAGDLFGFGIGISGDWAIIGASSDDDGGVDSGSAYVFSRDAGGVWSEQQKLVATDGATGDRFGLASAIDGETILVGAVLASHPVWATSDSGAAYVFERNSAGDWTETQKLEPDDWTFVINFGISVAIDDRSAVIGAPLDLTSGSTRGAAYLFGRDGFGTWREYKKLTSTTPVDVDDQFGFSVAINEQTSLIGAFYDDQNGSNSGSAYAYTFDPPPLFQSVSVGDMNADGIGEIAVMRGSSTFAEIRDGQSGALLKTMTFLSSAFTAAEAVAVPDSDGNGIPELAMLGTRNSDGRIIVEIRNLTGVEAPRTIWFAAAHTPKAIRTVEGDADGNGIAEIAVLSTRNSDDRMLVEVKNAFGPTNPNAVWFMANNTPVDLEIVPDKDANGIPEVAVLSYRNSDGRIVTEIKNADGAPNPSAVWFMPGNKAIDLAAVGDKDGDGVSEIAVLSSRISNERNVVEIKNVVGPTNASAVWFSEWHTAKSVAEVNDFDNNGIPEVAVLSVRGDGLIAVEIKNAIGTINPRTLWYSPGYGAYGLTIAADTDNNNIEEAQVLLIRDSDGRILVQGRNATGNPSPNNYWFSP